MNQHFPTNQIRLFIGAELKYTQYNLFMSCKGKLLFVKEFNSPQNIPKASLNQHIARQTLGHPNGALLRDLEPHEEMKGLGAIQGKI